MEGRAKGKARKVRVGRGQCGRSLAVQGYEMFCKGIVAVWGKQEGGVHGIRKVWERWVVKLLQ